MCVYDSTSLLEIEDEGDHFGGGAVDGLGIFQEGSIDEVGAVVSEDVTQAEAELQFGNELEIREVDIATHTYFDVTVETFGEQGTVLAGGEVDGGRYADGRIGTEIVVARRSYLEVNGNSEIGRFEVLRRVAPRDLFMEHGVLLPEMNGRLQAQAKGLVKTQFAEHTHGEAGLVVVDLGVPLLTCFHCSAPPCPSCSRL